MVIRRCLFGLLTLVALAGCGGENEESPPAATSAPPTVTSPAEREITVGQLADRIAAAWQSVSAYRVAFTSASIGTDGSVIPSPIVIVDEIVLPDRKRRVTSSGSDTLSETVVIGDAMSIRGTLHPGLVPAADPSLWQTVDPNAFPADSPFRALYANLLSPISPPYSRLSPDERARIANPVGNVEAGGRTCEAFRVADTTSTGDRVTIVIALGPTGLPCAIETRVAGTDNRQDFTYDPSIAIESPASSGPAILEVAPTSVPTP